MKYRGLCTRHFLDKHFFIWSTKQSTHGGGKSEGLPRPSTGAGNRKQGVVYCYMSGVVLND